jgi:hypothetical protein
VSRHDKRKLVALRRERRELRNGRAIGSWWGVPWCRHRKPQACEGCATRAYLASRLAEVEHQIARLDGTVELAEGELMTLVAGRWVLVEAVSGHA